MECAHGTRWKLDLLGLLNKNARLNSGSRILVLFVRTDAPQRRREFISRRRRARDGSLFGRAFDKRLTRERRMSSPLCREWMPQDLNTYRGQNISPPPHPLNVPFTVSTFSRSSVSASSYSSRSSLLCIFSFALSRLQAASCLRSPDHYFSSDNSSSITVATAFRREAQLPLILSRVNVPDCLHVYCFAYSESQ